MPEEILPSPENQNPLLETLKKHFKKIRVEIDPLKAGDLVSPKRRLSMSNNVRHVEDILPTQTTRNIIDHIIEGTVTDYSTLTPEQKKYILMFLGNEGGNNYDYDRKENITNRETIGRDKFLANLKEKRKAQKPFEEFREKYSTFLTTNSSLTPEQAEELIDEIASSTGKSREEIQEIYDQSENDLQTFETRLYKKYYSLGVCGDIHLFLAETAHAMGFSDAALISTSQKGSAHALTTLRDENGKIVFVDYGRYIETGSSDFRVALSVLEQNQEAIALNYHIQQPDGTLIIIESTASKQLSTIAREQQSIQEILDSGIKPDESYFDFTLGESAKLQLSAETLRGLTFMHIEYLRNEDDITNAIADGYAIKLGQRWTDQESIISGGAALTYANLNTKQVSPFTNERPNFQQLILNIFGRVNSKFQLSENFRLQLAAASDIAVAYSLAHSSREYNEQADRFSSTAGDIDFGARIAYILPSGQLYLDGTLENTFAPKKIQEATLDPTKLQMLHELSVATGLKIHPGYLAGVPVNINLKAQANFSPHLHRFGIESETTLGPNSLGLSATTQDSNTSFIEEYDRLNLTLGHQPNEAIQVQVYGFFDQNNANILDRFGTGMKIILIH